MSASADKYIGIGATLTIGSVSFPQSMVKSITLPNPTVESIETTNQGSVMKEYISGLADPGKVSAEVFFDPAGADITSLRGFLSARSTQDCTIGLVPAGEQVEFSGFITSLTPSAYEPGSVAMMTIEIQVSGAPTWGAIS